MYTIIGVLVISLIGISIYAFTRPACKECKECQVCPPPPTPPPKPETIMAPGLAPAGVTCARYCSSDWNKVLPTNWKSAKCVTGSTQDINGKVQSLSCDINPDNSAKNILCKCQRDDEGIKLQPCWPNVSPFCGCIQGIDDYTTKDSLCLSKPSS